MAGQRARLTSAAAIVAVCAGCAVAGPAEDSGPTRPSAGGEPLVVLAEPLAAPLIPDPLPAGLSVRAVTYNPPDRASGNGATLYGDPELADTLDGPLLVVGSSGGSACLGGPPGGPEDGRTVDLGSRDGFLIEEAGLTWIGDVSHGQDYVEFVVGRGVPETELIAAASTMRFDRQTGTEPPTISPDAVPEGMAPLVVGPGSNGPYAGVGQSLSLTGDDVGGLRITVYAVQADPRLAALWGFWANDPVGTTVRGQAGSAGLLVGTYCDSVEPGRIWAEEGMVIAVTGQEASDERVDEVVRSLRVGTEEELADLGQARLAEEPTGEDAGCPPDSLVVSAVQGDLRWVFAVGTLPDYPDLGPQSCATLITASGNNGLGTGDLNLGPLGQVTLAGGGLDSGELAGYLVAGVAPPGTARVTIGTPEGDVVEADLGDEGPRPGERLFGWFDEVPLLGDRRYDVTALDDAGTTLAIARF